MLFAGDPQRLLAGAGYAVAVDPALHHFLCHVVQLRVLLAQQSLHVALTDAEAGLSLGVSSLHHVSATHRDDGITCLHQQAREFNSGLFHNLKQIHGRADRGQRLSHDLNLTDRALLGVGMGAADDCVAALQAVDGNKDNVKYRSSRGSGTAQHAHGFCIGAKASHRVLFDQSQRLLALDAVVKQHGTASHGCQRLQIAHAGFDHIDLRNFHGMCHRCLGDGLDHLVDLLLRITGNLFDRYFALLHQRINVSLVIHEKPPIKI